MEKRFGVKDLFLFLLLGGLIVVVVLAMTQFDRQWDDVKVLKKQNTDLERDLTGIKRDLRAVTDGIEELRSRPLAVLPPAGGQGASATQPATVATTTAPARRPDVFTHLREAEKQPDFARGDWFVDNFETKVGKLTPLVSSDIYQRWVQSQVFETMIALDPYTLEYVPQVAQRWEQSEDGLRAKFFLRRGVEFSDGTPLTADDVVFTFDWVRNPAVNAPAERSFLTELAEVKKIDDLTVEFVFKKFYYLNFGFVGGSVPILSKRFYSRFTPDQFNEKPGLVFGSGPYKMEDPENWSPGKLVQLLRNERYWGPPPTFNRIVYREIEGEAAELVRYGNQEIDLMRCLPDQYRKARSDARLMSFSTTHEFSSTYKGFTYIGWNQVRLRDGKPTPTLFSDKRVRQAMAMLLDRERLARDVFLGYAVVASGPFAPGSKQADPAVKPWPYDEARAKALLAEVGYADRNGDGIIEAADGTPFRFKLSYPSGNETWEKIVLFMRDSYARAGIAMEPDRIDFPVLIKRTREKDFDAYAIGWSSTPESDNYQIFHSSQIGDQGDNTTSYSSKEMDAAIEKARGTVDTAERMKLWNEVHRIVHEDQPYMFMFNRKELYVFNGRIRNIKPAPIGINFEYLNGGMIPWYVPTGAQKYTQ